MLINSTTICMGAIGLIILVTRSMRLYSICLNCDGWLFVEFLDIFAFPLMV